MPTVKKRPKTQIKTIPLVGQFTARGFAKSIGTSAKDQQYINVLFEVASNPQLGSKILYANKRPGSTTGSTVTSGISNIVSYSSYFAGLSATTSTLYRGTTAIGTFNGAIIDFAVSDTVMNAQDVICFADGAGGGYFCFKDAVTTNFPTFTGDTHTNTTIDGIASTTGLYKGQLISGTGIQAGTRISSVDSATAITTTLATTATNAGVTITKEAVAKVIDSDYPSAVNSVTANGGYMFSVATNGGPIFNSDINQPWSVGASNYITPDFSADGTTRIQKIGETIVAVGVSSLQFFTITGNTSGSVLSVNRGANQYSATAINNVIWVGPSGYAIQTQSESGGALVRVSPSSYEQKLITDSVTGPIIYDSSLLIIGWIQILGNKNLILITPSSGSGASLVYDPSTNMFSEFISDARINSSWSTSFTKQGSSSLFTWASGNTWTDSSVAYTMTIQSESLSLNGGEPFIIKKAKLIADTQSSGSAALAYSSDDYANFTTVGSFDLTAQDKEVWGGIYCDSAVAFKLTDSGNNAFRGQAIIIEWEPCFR